MHICLTRPPWVNSSSKLSIHWDWVTHVCVRKLPMIDSDNGLSPVQHLAIIWINAVLLLIGWDRRQAQDQHPYWHPCSSSLGTYKNSTQGNTAREPHHGLVNRALQKLTVVEEIVAGWPVPVSDENLDCSCRASQSQGGITPVRYNTTNSKLVDTSLQKVTLNHTTDAIAN